MNENADINVLRVLEQLGDKIIDLYRRRLYEGNSDASGLLGNSLGVTVQTDDGIYSANLLIEDYWKYVEDGRNPGRFPNIEEIKQWIQIKPIIPNIRNGKLPTIDDLTYMIGRSIALKGIKGKGYLGSVLRELENDPLFDEAVTKDIENKVDLIFKNF